MKRLCFFVGCFALIQLMVRAQSPEESFGLSHHKFTLVLAHANLSRGINASTGKRQWQSLPAWCLDYDFMPSEKWHIGLHNDIITETYEVEDNENKTIQRTRPISSSIIGTYKFTPHWAFQLGMGGEFAKEQNFVLTRLGLEYGWELPGNFELSGVLNYDIKWNAYDTYVIGIGIAKLLQ
jgi:hypothetical protein